MTLTQPYHILKIIFGSLSILLNGLLLLAIFVERKKLFVSRISYLVANLALADFLAGFVLVFFVQPIQIHEKSQLIVKLEVPFTWTTMIISFLTLFHMSAERFLVVALPMLWSNILTNRRTVIAICITWTLAIISGVAVYYHKPKTLFVLVATVEVCVVVYIGVHVYIVWFLKTHQSLQSSDEERTEVRPLPSPKKASDMSVKQHREMTAVVAILLVVLIFTVIPHLICLQIYVTDMLFDPTIIASFNRKKLTLAYNYTCAFMYLNFVVNPIVYAWRLKMYRRAFVKLFRSICF